MALASSRKASVVMQYHDFSKSPRIALIGTVLMLLVFETVPSGPPTLWAVLTKEMVQLSKYVGDGDADDYSPTVSLKPSYGQTTILRCYCTYLQFETSIKNGKKKIASLYMKRILIVDDEADITFALRKALADNGFKQVDTYNDPLLALERFKPGLYDLLILDVIMPQMDGFKIYEKMKKIDNKVKVCFITAYDVNYQAIRAVFPAVNTTDELECFIRKPVEVQQLLKHVKRELDQH